MTRTADPTTERSSCCNAPVTYGDGGLYCKKCFETCVWKDDPGAPLGVDTHGTAFKLNLPRNA